MVRLQPELSIDDSGSRADMGDAGLILVGIIGYTPVVETFPLGPGLMAALKRDVATRPGASLENMTWGPIHVVQRFQDEGAIRPARLILVGAASVCRQPGRVRAFRWCGGKLPGAQMQERIYEAVTGIVDIENTLIIGTHFGVWPSETFAVEIDLAANTFGSLVIAESEGGADEAAIERELGFRPSEVIETTRRFVLQLIDDGNSAACEPAAKSAQELAPVAQFARNEIVSVAAGTETQF
jgi:hypothetical protein